jgi:polyhydroxyalkanoate synthase subunit PhaC
VCNFDQPRPLPDYHFRALLAATLAYLTAKKDDRIGSTTYFVALVDFTDAGDLAVFIDEQQLAVIERVIERRMRKRGYLEGRGNLSATWLRG